MATPLGKHREKNKQASTSSARTNGILVAERLGSSMIHNPGISTEWSPEEQAVLEEGLSNYASESSLICYAKTAMQLQHKTVRDVALRCRWMTKKESSKRRKEEHNKTRKSRDRKERAADTSSKPANLAIQMDVPPCAPSLALTGHNDGTAYKAIAGATGELLEQNAQIFSHISANLQSLQLRENVSLFCRTRDNILKILNSMNESPDIMKQMPTLPIKLNEELANAILPSTSTL